MSSKLFSIFVFIFATWNICSATLRRRQQMDIGQYNSSYYDPSNGVGLKAELEESGRHPFLARISFRGLSCVCEQLTCNCCAGVNMTAIRFNRVACTKFAYDPNDLAIKISFLMNEKEIYSNTISAKNPPPLCIPFPYLPIMTFCVRFYDIYMVDKNLHACIDLETRMVGSPILILHFNCVQMGMDGISWSKPDEDNDQIDQQAEQQQQPPQQIAEPEEYDDVDFEQEDLEVYSNYTSTLSPEEEAQIGQLKL